MQIIQYYNLVLADNSCTEGIIPVAAKICTVLNDQLTRSVLY